MIKKSNKNKILFLNKMIKNKYGNIFYSVIQNNEINLLKRQFFNIKKEKIKKEKKECLFGISNKYIDRKSKFSRFAISKIINNNLNQNFKIYN